jgi:hypothetical protein
LALRVPKPLVQSGVRWTRVSRIRTIGLLLAGSLVNSGIIAAQQEDGEYRAKARFLANAPDFVGRLKCRKIDSRSGCSPLPR